MFGLFKKKESNNNNGLKVPYDEIMNIASIMSDCFYEEAVEVGVEPDGVLNPESDEKLIYTFRDKVIKRLPRVKDAFESLILGPMQYYLNQVAGRVHGRDKNGYKAYPGTLALASTLGYINYLGQIHISQELLSDIRKTINKKFNNIGEDLELLGDWDF